MHQGRRFKIFLDGGHFKILFFSTPSPSSSIFFIMLLVHFIFKTPKFFFNIFSHYILKKQLIINITKRSKCPPFQTRLMHNIG